MKRIISIILTLVMILSMTTACSTNTPLPTDSTSEPTNTTEAPTTEPDESTPTEPIFKVSPLGWNIDKLSLQEISELSAEMLKLSYEDLTIEDINQLGLNFYYIIVTSLTKTDLTENVLDRLSADSFEALCNVINQARAKDFSQYYLTSWSTIPVEDVLVKCYSSLSDTSIFLSCSPILYGYLPEDEAINVATVFLTNYSTKNSPNGIFDCILSIYPKVQKMGIERLLDFSKCSTTLSSTTQTSLFFHIDDNTFVNDVLTEEVLFEVRSNVLKNRYFDFVEKYTALCNSVDEEVAEQAFSRLLEISKDNPDEETTAEIKKIANALWDVDMAKVLLNTLNS